MIKDTLEIILITYNRKPFLQKTFKQLLADNSPVKDLNITVLDNCSTDDTNNYLNELCTKHPNIKHIRHNRNIGGNANIARAFEIVTKPYFWILSDDDKYDFSAWQQVEQAIKENADLIVVNTEEIRNQTDILKALRRLTFLPANIFKASVLDDNTMRNIYDNVPNWFPHFAAICAIINKNGKIKIIPQDIVLQDNRNTDGYSAHRCGKNIYPRQANLFFDVGYLNSLELINDPYKRAKAVDSFAYGKSFFKQVKNTFKCNRIEHNNYLRNIQGPKAVFNTRQKFLFNAAMLFNDICYFFKYPKYYLRRKKNAKKNSVKTSGK